MDITHLLFVDDVILFGLGIVDEWIAYKEALDLFWSATGMSVSLEKSSFLFDDVDEEIRLHISALLPFKMDPIYTGFKYLGYHIKPLGYRMIGWHWLFTKFEKRISNWTYRLLSLGGRVILIISVLSSLVV